MRSKVKNKVDNDTDGRSDVFVVWIKNIGVVKIIWWKKENEQFCWLILPYVIKATQLFRACGRFSLQNGEIVIRLDIHH